MAQYVATTKTSNRIVATARKIASLDPIPDGPNILKLALDVTSQSSIDTAVTTALDKFDSIDVMVNNAGYSILGDTESATDEQ